MKYAKVMMSIAGWDSCGGAGVLADMRVAEAVGCYGTAVVTAITAQNTLGISSVWPLKREQIREQGFVLLDDIWPQAVKVGMLGDEESAKGVRDVLLRYVETASHLAANNIVGGRANIVADTIIKSSSGASLFEADGMEPMLDILKLARVITPNIPEAQSLGSVILDTGSPKTNDAVAKTNGNAADAEDVAASPRNAEEWTRALSAECDGASVFLKGGHGEGETLTDIFFNAETNEILRFSHPRVATNNTHGTGCTLSSALAGYLARGYKLNDAAKCASAFTYNSLKAGAHLSLGHGHGPAYFGGGFV